MAEHMADSANLTLSIARGDAGTSASETAALLRERLIVFTRLMSGFFAAGFLGGIAVIAVVRPGFLLESFLVPTRLVHFGELVFLVALSAVLQRTHPSLATLKGIDLSIAAGVAVPMSIAFGLTSIGYFVVFAAVMLVLMMLTLRAAIVPSPPQRTALAGVLGGVPLVSLAYLKSRNDVTMPPLLTPQLLTIGVLAWCVATTAATTVTSRVIYGLQAEVRQALRLGQYTLLQKIGEGGMGSVYLARHAMLRRPTAVKLLPPDRSGPAQLARFEREVQLTSILTHPNTIAIYDYGRTTNGVFYYAMEYVDGLSLEELVRSDGPQPPGRVVHVLQKIAGALAEAHRIGLVHRDVKPANVLLSDRGGAPDTVKVVDFGLVKEIQNASGANVTHAGALTGTPAYLAPEMISTPEQAGPEADLYALGAVGYFMLTGSLVFAGASVVEICGHHLHTRPEPPSQRRGEPLPAALELLILRCLAKSPSERPCSASSLEAELSTLALELPWSPSEAGAWWQKLRAQDRQTGAETERQAEREKLTA